MKKFIFQKQEWKPFTHGGQTYALDHLNEYCFVVSDSARQERNIAVTFEDHCFTRPPNPNEQAPLLEVPGSSRRPGYFCFDRYRYSLNLRAHIALAVAPRKPVWNVDGGNFAFVPTLDHNGSPALYGIIFVLNRVKGLSVDLHMNVKTAYPCNESELVTFGFTRFEHLVALRMVNKRPNLLRDHGRKRPVLSAT